MFENGSGNLSSVVCSTSCEGLHKGKNSSASKDILADLEVCLYL